MKAQAFESYHDKYENVRMKRQEGILEVALHTRGGPLVFNGCVHEALVHTFRDIGDDPDNHVVILTGTGDEFCAQISPDGFDFFTPTGYDKILREGTKVLGNILDIEVPMIAAINGPLTVHSEYALLCDIVLAAAGAYFQDVAHPAFGVVPGDGLHVVWPEVIGEIRGRYFLLSSQKLSAVEAKEYGAVNEVLPREALIPRAWELARHLMKQNPLTLRYTRMALSTRFRRRLQESLSYGLALEGISAAQVAASKGRPEGSHQLTAQEVSQFHRYRLKPIIFVLNNDGYLIERLLCKDFDSYYNDLAKWHYHKLPEALGCDGWFAARVTTCGELDSAIKKAESSGTGAYIEVVTDRHAASPLSQKMHESIASLYS